MNKYVSEIFLVSYCLLCYGLCVGMHTPRLCLGKRPLSTGITTTSVPTRAKHVDAEIPAFAGMTKFMEVVIFFVIVRRRSRRGNLLVPQTFSWS